MSTTQPNALPTLTEVSAELERLHTQFQAEADSIIVPTGKSQYAAECHKQLRAGMAIGVMAASIRIDSMILKATASGASA